MTPTVLLLVGASGHLAKTKIIPALYHLYSTNKLANTIVIGVSFEYATSQEILQSSQSYFYEYCHITYTSFASIFHYHMLNKHTNDFNAVADALRSIMPEAICYNLLVYCAIPSSAFIKTVACLAASNILKYQEHAQEHGWHRVIFEKPFGHDTQSAAELNATIHRYIAEQQVYRIDHYLGKESISSLISLRFANIIFEPLWNYRSINALEIVIDETQDLQARQFYYESYGVIRDMVQNHVVQMLALLTMEEPKSMDVQDIQDAKVNLLKSVALVQGITAQYRGYRQLQGVSVDSKTPTFAVLQFSIDNERWQGVPCIVRTGKALAKRQAYIKIYFKHSKSSLFKQNSANVLTIQIHPAPCLQLELTIKKPLYHHQLQKATMHCSYQAIAHSDTLFNSYQTVLLEVLQAHQSSGVRSDEILQAWRIADSIIAHSMPLFYYEQGSDGPVEQKTMYETLNKMKGGI